MIWKIAPILFLLVGLGKHTNAQINEKIWNYIVQYRNVAIEEMNRTGIPASITLAQGLLESGIGASRLATEGNNHFGIKCHDWTGPSLRYTDDAPNECFRKYASVYESFIDHSNFLTGRKRYQVLFTYDKEDYVRWAKGLKRCGYATNPKYAELLIKKIERYYLHIFDKPNWADLWAIVETNQQLSMGDSYTKIVQSPTKVMVQKPAQPKKRMRRKTETAAVEKTVAAPASKKNQSTSNREEVEAVNPSINATPKKVLSESYRFTQINNLRAVIYSISVTVVDVAAIHQMRMKKLYRFNDLDGFTTFAPNIPIFLQNKKRVYNGSASIHQVKTGETIEAIAQQYGVKQVNLRKLNLLHPTQEPRLDELIYLKKKRKIPPKIR